MCFVPILIIWLTFYAAVHFCNCMLSWCPADKICPGLDEQNLNTHFTLLLGTPAQQLINTNIYLAHHMSAAACMHLSM